MKKDDIKNYKIEPAKPKNCFIEWEVLPARKTGFCRVCLMIALILPALIQFQEKPNTARLGFDAVGLRILFVVWLVAFVLYLYYRDFHFIRKYQKDKDKDSIRLILVAVVLTLSWIYCLDARHYDDRILDKTDYSYVYTYTENHSTTKRKTSRTTWTTTSNNAKVPTTTSRRFPSHHTTTTRKSSDPYHANEYDFPEDFYDDYYDDFFDYEDAEDYWDDHT